MEIHSLTEQIQRLELQLLQSDLNEHPELIDQLLAANFEEIDNRGQLHCRDDVVGWLMRKDPHLHWAFTHFRVKVLTEDLALAIYSVKNPARSDAQLTQAPGSIRTSLWQRQGDDWKMIFHQATKITGAPAT